METFYNFFFTNEPYFEFAKFVLKIPFFLCYQSFHVERADSIKC